MRTTTFLSTALSLGASGVAAAAVDVAPRAAAPCDDVHMFLARGNNEPYPGRQGKMVELICQDLSGSCGYEDLIYSALYTDLYCQTVYDGVVAGFTQLSAYANRCPSSKLILLGYSQGAQIVTDILAGGGATLYNGCVQPDTPALDRSTAPGNMVRAALTFGNVRHDGNQAYNFGNGSAIDSQFPRDGKMLGALNSWTPILRDWCVNVDPICAHGQPESYVQSHLNYFDIYANEAVQWVRSVAGLKQDGHFATKIPISISGTAQDYATIGTETPSGSVHINTDWTKVTAVTAKATSAVTTSTTSSVSASTAASSSSATVASSTGSGHALSTSTQAAQSTTTDAPVSSTGASVPPPSSVLTTTVDAVTRPIDNPAGTSSAPASSSSVPAGSGANALLPNAAFLAVLALGPLAAALV